MRVPPASHGVRTHRSSLAARGRSSRAFDQLPRRAPGRIPPGGFSRGLRARCDRPFDVDSLLDTSRSTGVCDHPWQHYTSRKRSERVTATRLGRTVSAASRAGVSSSVGPRLRASDRRQPLERGSRAARRRDQPRSASVKVSRRVLRRGAPRAGTFRSAIPRSPKP